MYQVQGSPSCCGDSSWRCFCRGCFKVFYLHKFRARFREKQRISPGKKVPPGLSLEGPSSGSKIWQIHAGLTGDSVKRLPYVTRVVSVNEGAAYGQSPEGRAQTLAEVRLTPQTCRYCGALSREVFEKR